MGTKGVVVGTKGVVVGTKGVVVGTKGVVVGTKGVVVGTKGVVVGTKGVVVGTKGVVVGTKGVVGRPLVALAHIWQLGFLRPPPGPPTRNGRRRRRRRRHRAAKGTLELEAPVAHGRDAARRALTHQIRVGKSIDGDGCVRPAATPIVAAVAHAACQPLVKPSGTRAAPSKRVGARPQPNVSPSLTEPEEEEGPPRAQPLSLVHRALGGGE